MTPHVCFFGGWLYGQGVFLCSRFVINGRLLHDITRLAWSSAVQAAEASDPLLERNNGRPSSTSGEFLSNVDRFHVPGMTPHARFWGVIVWPVYASCVLTLL